LALQRLVRGSNVTTRHDRLGKIGAKVVTRDPFVIFGRAEMAVPRNMVVEILKGIGWQRPARDQGEFRHSEMKKTQPRWRRSPGKRT
jgi:hypothetical protein